MDDDTQKSPDDDAKIEDLVLDKDATDDVRGGAPKLPPPTTPISAPPPPRK